MGANCMSDNVAWIRLDVDWDRALWIRSEKRFVKDVWPNLLRLVKILSPRKGRIKFRDIYDLAEQMRYSSDEMWTVERLVEVAQIDHDGHGSAITIEGGILVINNWIKYQSPTAQRVSAFRERENTIDDENSGVTYDVQALHTTVPALQIDYVTPCNGKSRARDTATQQHSNTATPENTKNTKETTAPENREGKNLFSQVQAVLLDTPQFQVSGINTRLLDGVVAQYLQLVAPEVVLTEAWGAQRYLKRHPSKKYTEANLFFANWLKKAEAAARKRPETAVTRRGLEPALAVPDKLQEGSIFAQSDC